MALAQRFVSLTFVMWLFSVNAEDHFYQRFLTLIDTNRPGALPIRSPFLIDTNNTAGKLTNGVLDLRESCAVGEVGGIRLGMRMEEVAAAWGNPTFIWGRCFGGPRFLYTDASVIFAPGSNSVMRIFVGDKLNIRIKGGLTGGSTIDQCVRVLGDPSARTDHPRTYLFYESPRSTLRLSFSEGALWHVQLDTPSVGRK